MYDHPASPNIVPVPWTVLFIFICMYNISMCTMLLVLRGMVFSDTTRKKWRRGMTPGGGVSKRLTTNICRHYISLNTIYIQ